MKLSSILLLLWITVSAAEDMDNAPTAGTNPTTSMEIIDNSAIGEKNDAQTTTKSTVEEKPSSTIGCICGVFLSGQFKKGSKEQPKGNPALLHEHSDSFPCNLMGNKMCTNKCLDIIVKHLPNSPAILCGSIDRDCHKERAYLFIKNCKNEWINTNLSAGREYCCKDGIPYKCPIMS